MREIYLNNKKLTELGRGAFRELSALNYLGLFHNQIQSIKTKTFAELKNIRYVDLYQNNLRKLRSKVFAGLSKPFKLTLRGNERFVLSLSTMHYIQNKDRSSIPLLGHQLVGRGQLRYRYFPVKM